MLRHYPTGCVLVQWDRDAKLVIWCCPRDKTIGDGAFKGREGVING